MNKFVCIFLSLILCVSGFTFSATAQGVSIVCKSDTYSESNAFSTRNYEKSEILLSGTVYNRSAVFKFDISQLKSVQYKGCVMSIWVRNNFADSKLTFSDDAGNKITTLTLGNTGLVKCEIDLSDFIAESLDCSKYEITLYAHYDGSVITIFSSEYTENKFMRPCLYTTDMVPYFPNQKSFEYPVVTKHDFKKELTSMVSKGHPYLFGDSEDFERIKENALGQNSEMTLFYNNVKALASGYLDNNPTPITVDITKDANFNRAQECYYVVSRCAFIYLIEGDERYAKRAWDEAKFFVDLPSWGTVQFLDNNQIFGATR